MKNLAYVFGIFLEVFAFASSSHAHCGLDYCPRLAPGETPLDHSASLLIKNTAFNLDSGSGNYQEIQARYEYLGIHSWVFGASLPLIALTVHSKMPPLESHADYGFSNPLLYASWYAPMGTASMLYLGLQLELPFGNFDAGMAGDHFMLVPYALVERSFGSGYALAGVGFSQAYSVGDAEEHALYVNPHEDREIQYRLGGGWRTWADRLTPHFSLNGKYAVVDELEGEGRSHLAGGIGVGLKLAGRLEVTPSMELPLTNPERFEWESGVEIKGKF